MIHDVISEVGQSCTAKCNASDGHFKVCEDGSVCNSKSDICEMSPSSTPIVQIADNLDDKSDD